MTDIGMKLIRKIHEGGDNTCYQAILKAWDLDDPLYSDKNMQIKVEILKRYRGSNHLSIEEIAKELHIRSSTVIKHIRQYDALQDRYWNPDEINHNMYDRMYNTNAFLKKCEELSSSGSEDTYFSLNSFWRMNKAGMDVRHINAFVLDFDYYKIHQYKDMEAAKFYKKKIQRKLPMVPTGVVDSGRGLYVIYAFEHCSYHMERLYRAVTKSFYERFKGYGMDKLALNITQVIRIPGTLNTNSLREVKVLEFNNTSYKIQDFADLLPYSQQEVKDHKIEKLKSVDKLRKNKIPACSDLSKRKPYFKDFFDDVKKLIVLRNRSKKYRGYREQLLYLVRERATWCGYSVAESVKLAMECNEIMHIPLSYSDVEKQCRPSRGRQKTSIETIIDKLNINITEQQELKVLRRKWLKKSMYSRRKQKHPLLNITNKKFQILQRRTSVCELKNKQHLKNADIALVLGVNKSTITRDIRYIKDHPAEFRVELKTYMDDLESRRHSDDFKRCTTYDIQQQLLKWLKRGYTALEFLVRDIGVAKN